MHYNIAIDSVSVITKRNKKLEIPIGTEDTARVLISPITEERCVMRIVKQVAFKPRVKEYRDTDDESGEPTVKDGIGRCEKVCLLSQGQQIAATVRSNPSITR